MSNELGVERLSYDDDLRDRADRFLSRFHPDGSIPVPIEEIIEIEFKMDIVPTPGLHQNFDIDAFITSNLTTIYVDEFVYASRPGRYRFSLAHELSHVILHESVYKKLKFSSIKEWREVVARIPQDEYGWIEWQAYALAGLILVPSEALKKRIKQTTIKLKKVGVALEETSEAARHLITDHLARGFLVSRDVIEKRLYKDRLLPFE